MLSQEELKKLQDDFIQKVNESSYNQYKDKIITTGANPSVIASNKPIFKLLLEELQDINFTSKEIIFMTINGVEKTAQNRFCKICGKPNLLEYVDQGYNKYCSRECFNNDPNKSSTKRTTDAYGLDKNSLDYKSKLYDAIKETLKLTPIDLDVTKSEYLSNKKLKYKCAICGCTNITAKVMQKEFTCEDCKKIVQSTPAKVREAEIIDRSSIISITSEHLQEIQENFIQQVKDSSFIKLKDRIKMDCKNPIMVGSNKPIFRHLENELDMTAKEILYMKLNGIEETAKYKFCPVCGHSNDIPRVSTGYNEFCCYECSIKSGVIKERSSNTMIEKYGVPHAMQAQQFKDKRDETCMEKYGVRNPWCDAEVRKKSEETSIERYGVPFASQNPEHMQRIKDIWTEKYGVDNPGKSPEIRAKINQTNTERYGGNSPVSDPEIFARVIQSKVENGTTNTSKPEEETYEVLLKYYPEVIRQYKDERYPFNCDFYIPINDQFIELNYNWTHGKEPYDANNKDHQLILETYMEKAKTSDYYKSAIHVWTKADPLKKKTLIENNLKHNIFYNEDEFNEWISLVHPKDYYEGLPINYTEDE